MNHRAKAFTIAAFAALVSIASLAQGLRPSTTQNLALPSAARPAGDDKKTADFIVAVVNSEPITNNEVRNETARLAQQLAQARRPRPADAELSRMVLERLINDKTQLQLAREYGVRIEDAAVEQAEQNIAQQNQMDVAQLHKRLAAQGMGVSQYREQLRDQLTLNRLREREVDARVRVSDLEVDQYLRDQPQGGDPSKQEINMAQILVAVPENASPEQLAILQTRAEGILKRARANEDFAALAKTMSDAPDGANGGQLGLRSAERYPPLFLDALLAQPTGSISEVVRSGAGFHILKLLEKRAPGMSVNQTRARHILLRPSAQLNEAQARDRLAEFKQRIQSGQADFAVLARENSQDGSATQGGDLGWASPGQYVPEFEGVMNTLAPGQISDPLISRYGVHLIQVTERRTAELSPKEQREMTRNLLRDKKLDTAFTTWAQDVRGRAYVEFRDAPRLD
jgi:peptidyl-prolyl cis-trans isomerase SurA